MEDLDRLLIERDCERLVTAHCDYIDCQIVDEDHANGVTYFTVHRHDDVLEGTVAPLRDAAVMVDGGYTAIGGGTRRTQRCSHSLPIGVRDDPVADRGYA
ncbi:MAG: hypothetical protein QNM02_19280 [Acidimicrobiia bacterium]|nr:hypothetical protein [Acidimicrobiia bacterium]